MFDTEAVLAKRINAAGTGGYIAVSLQFHCDRKRLRRNEQKQKVQTNFRKLFNHNFNQSVHETFQIRMNVGVFPND